MIRPNLEKLDKSKYPKFDRGPLPKTEIKSTTKLNTITGKFIDEEKNNLFALVVRLIAIKVISFYETNA